MGQFLSKITAQYNPPRKWIMKEDLTYICTELTEDETQALIQIGVKSLVNVKNEKEIKVETGFETDLASVPRLCWNIIAPWDVARAAIIHDLLYKRIRQYRWNGHGNGEDEDTNVNKEEKALIKLAKKASDNVFLNGMKDADPKVPKWKILTAYYAVVLFGRWSIIPNEDNI